MTPSSHLPFGLVTGATGRTFVLGTKDDKNTMVQIRVRHKL